MSALSTVSTTPTTPTPPASPTPPTAPAPPATPTVPFGLARSLRRAWIINRPLTLVGAAMVVVLLTAVVGLLVDPRVITGAAAWLKPAKFAISIALYSFTLIWLLTFVPGRKRLIAAISWITAACLAVEVTLIAGAAAVATTSHFNVSTPLHAAVWSTMAGAIIAVWMANLVVGVLLIRAPIADRAFAVSLRLGVFGSALGMGLAFLMTSPTAQQLAAARSSGAMPVVGAHSVGVSDGGPGLPVVGWSTVAGDLRIGHFLGLHALQALPLIGYLVAKVTVPWLRPADRLALVWTIGMSYLGLVGLVTWQALRGQSLIHPDAATWAAWTTLAAVTALAASVVLVRARRAWSVSHRV